MNFVVENGILGLSIADEHIAEMVKYIATSGTNETGGVLIGYYTEDHKQAVICDITAPPGRFQEWALLVQARYNGFKAALQQCMEK